MRSGGRNGNLIMLFFRILRIARGSVRAACCGMTTTTEIPIDELTHKIIGAAVEAHTNLGPGLLESVYQDCLTLELKLRQLRVERVRHVPLIY